MDKNLIREKMKKLRRSLTAEEIAQKSEIISDKLFMQSVFSDAETVMVYLSAFKEVDTAPIIQKLYKLNKKVIVPISNTETETITLSYLRSSSFMRKGAYGIWEPETIIPANETDLDIVLTPGLAFDKSCRRIGFGKGYYDKLLCRTDAYKIGLCYDFQLTESILTDRHDIPMDMIITEKNIIRRTDNAF